MARARAQGYALVDQELEFGLRTITVPLKNFRGNVVVAMNVSVQAERLPLAQMVECCLPAMIKIQVELAALLRHPALHAPGGAAIRHWPSS